MKPALSPYRYVICFCSCLLIFMSVGLLSNAFPIYFPFIMKEHQFSNTQLSLLTTMRSVTALICMFFTDRYYARLNLKRGIYLPAMTGRLPFPPIPANPAHSFFSSSGFVSPPASFLSASSD